MKIILLLAIFITSFVYSQNFDKKYSLNWKIPQSEYLVYEIETSQIDIEENDYNHYIKAITSQTGELDSISLVNSFKKVNETIANDAKNYKSLAVLSNNGDRIDITVIRTIKNPEIKSTYNIPTGVQLKGSLNKDGSIYSKYLKAQQKNLIAIFFQLPAKDVAVGDKWNIDLQWLSADQNFICDYATQKSEAILVSVEKIEDNQIAKVKYLITEQIVGANQIPGSEDKKAYNVKFEHIGFAYFNITKGRWIDYDIINATDVSGVQNISQKSRYKLIDSELDVFSKSIMSE